MPSVRFTKAHQIGTVTQSVGTVVDLTDEQAKEAAGSFELLARTRFAKDWTDAGMAFPANFEYRLPLDQARRAHAAGVVAEGSEAAPAEVKAEPKAEARHRTRAEG